jgi:CCR4-NOT transcription complex subunit 7/8
MFFEDNIDDAKYCGHLYGLGTSYVQNGVMAEAISYSITNSHSVVHNGGDETGTLPS